MLRLLVAILCILIFSGCAKIAHMQELLTLKRYSENKDAQALYVDEQDQKFEALWQAVQEENLEKNITQKQILKSYGDPVFTKKVDLEGQPRELWLYRYAVRYFNSPKVYLYFDEGRLVQWEKFEPEMKEDE